jgi:DegV family protein with EDD domain
MIGDEAIEDGAITSEDLFARADRTGITPKTASPPPGAFLDAFHRAQERGAQSALCLTLPVSFSGTYAAALAGADLADFPVRVVDTGAVAAVHGFAVLAAAHALAEGKCLDEAVEAAHGAARRSELVGVIDSMKYVARNGRVPWIAGQAASLLGIKPVVAFSGGRARLVDRTRTTSDGLHRIMKRIETSPCGLISVEAVVLHAAAPALAETLAEAAKEQLNVQAMRIAECSLAMAAHVGPGFVALGVRPYA